MANAPKWIAYCSLPMLVALYVVGAVSNGSLRHEVQTLPLWIPIALGFGRRDLAKWLALPCFVFWLLIMVLIWMFLLGWAKVITGHYSVTEVVMTIVVGVASLTGIVIGLRSKTQVKPLIAAGSIVLASTLQIGVMAISLTPYIGSR